LYFFGRIEAFQWVMAEKNKKFRLRLNSRDGLWALVANRSVPPTGAGGMTELLIAEHYSNGFYLIQEKPTLTMLTVGRGNAELGRTCGGSEGVMAGLVPANHVVRRND
jgi:hypothetical protein